MLTLNSKPPIKAELSHHGSFGGAVKARYQNGDEAVCFVTYAAVGSDFVIASFGVNPRATVKDAQLGGDAIDSVLETEAFKLGIKRLLIVHPNQDTAEVVKTYALQPFTMGRISHHTNPITFLN